MNLKRTAIALVALAFAVAPVLAETSFTMTFDGITEAKTAPDFGKGVAEILAYYNGDPGPTFGVTFGPGALAINSKAAGGPGQFPKAYSGSSAAGSFGAEIKFELSDGLWLTAFNFYYDAPGGSAPAFQLFSGRKVVFEESLGCGDVGVDGFCGWTQYKLDKEVLAGLAPVTAVAFQAEGNTAVFDDVSLSTAGQTQPVPEPSSAALAALGLALVAGIARRRGG